MTEEGLLSVAYTSKSPCTSATTLLSYVWQWFGGDEHLESGESEW